LWQVLGSETCCNGNNSVSLALVLLVWQQKWHPTCDKPVPIILQVTSFTDSAQYVVTPEKTGLTKIVHFCAVGSIV